MALKSTLPPSISHHSIMAKRYFTLSFSSSAFHALQTSFSSLTKLLLEDHLSTVPQPLASMLSRASSHCLSQRSSWTITVNDAASPCSSAENQPRSKGGEKFRRFSNCRTRFGECINTFNER